MKKQTKADLQNEARSLRRFVTDPYLIGWLWPWDHARIVKLLQEVDKRWFEKNHNRILPPVPIQKVEIVRAALEDEYKLLV
ncbi:MAG: hypothetical protein ACK4TB_11030 [Gemmobacter sp.]